MDEINDCSWALITQCCIPEPKDRLRLAEVQNQLRKMGLEDNRPAEKPLPGAEILKYRVPYDPIDIRRTGEILDELKVG
jgi:hypothetical protein